MNYRFFLPFLGMIFVLSSCVPHTSEEQPGYANADRSLVDSVLIDSAGPGASLSGINERIARSSKAFDTTRMALRKEEDLLEAKLKEKETELETGKKTRSKLPEPKLSDPALEFDLNPELSSPDPSQASTAE